MNTATALAMFAMFLFGWMTLKSRRFIEYFPPFALIFGSLAFQSLLAPSGWLEETFATAAG